MECRIRFIDERLKKSFEEIKKSDDRLYKEINKAFEDISKNSYIGRNVKKELIPKKLIQKFGLNNLWIYNLRKDWRLIYTLSGSNEIEVVAFVLDWMNHKDYEKLFKF
jgi:Txe/YoeB family toxin of Txe-Axe toxin-antitoxin module